jgi:hypothetical protein
MLIIFDNKAIFVDNDGQKRQISNAIGCNTMHSHKFGLSPIMHIKVCAGFYIMCKKLRYSSLHCKLTIVSQPKTLEVKLREVDLSPLPLDIKLIRSSYVHKAVLIYYTQATSVSNKNLSSIGNRLSNPVYYQLIKLELFPLHSDVIPT